MQFVLVKSPSPIQRIMVLVVHLKVDVDAANVDEALRVRLAKVPAVMCSSYRVRTTLPWSWQQ